MTDSASRSQLGANVFNMMLSFCLLLALSSSVLLPPSLAISLFIGLSSLALSSASVALLASGLHHRLARLRLVQACSPYRPVRWRHLQFSLAISLASFHWIGFLLNWTSASSLPAPYHHAYSIASFFSLALCLSCLFTAILSTGDDEADELDQKGALVQQREQHRYTEL